MKTIELLERMELALGDHYDGAPDSKALWMGQLLLDIETIKTRAAVIEAEYKRVHEAAVKIFNDYYDAGHIIGINTSVLAHRITDLILADLLPDAAAQDRLVADLNDEEDPERFDGME